MMLFPSIAFMLNYKQILLEWRFSTKFAFVWILLEVFGNNLSWCLLGGRDVLWNRLGWNFYGIKCGGCFVMDNCAFEFRIFRNWWFFGNWFLSQFDDCVIIHNNWSFIFI
ncbi:hypothetical protein TRFO_26172 [Tritrichomonas foetus]|uniref:Uncharacterized protein n=1 Tax=Tritrichomonas foetus TaxID=1144522 RepID=A0A1J4K8B3_9EUKA|nr:hypothetical protein TRFO_26172 [Tritrichomonas foetus]|eukprot:OHT05902.1 hypothetical protein TRFO_26172 [Tritrichomonas foetus]